MNPQLIEYIKAALASGQSREAVTLALVQNGWKTEDIQQGFAGVAMPAFQEPVVVSNPSAPSNLPLFLIVGAVILIVAISGGLLLFGQKTKNNEATTSAPAVQAEVTAPILPIVVVPIIATTTDSASKDTFNQQKITVNSTASKFTCGPSTVIGSNSEVYKTVQIGTQCWMKQDMKGGLYTWAEALRLPPVCDTSSCKVTTNQQGVCPSGWHIPTDMEFKTLRIFLGMSESDASQAIFGGTDQGTQLKVGGTSGFDAITDSGFNGFWTSSEDSVTKAWVLSLFTNETTIGRGTNNKTHPTSVRCLKN